MRSPLSAAAFTLVEVILAIVIALGILVVLLYFYHQATNLRSQAIQETERIAAARLIMDRITSDLRAFKPGTRRGQAFSGSSNSIQFVKADVPSFSAWTGGALGRSAMPVTDLKVVKYQLAALGETNTGGLIRSEEPFVQFRGVRVDADIGTNAVSAASQTPVLDEIQFLQFRYWSGTNWLESWNLSSAPQAVEISMAGEPITNVADAVDSVIDVFRRVVYVTQPALAMSQPSSLLSGGAAPASSEEEEAP